MNEKFGAVVADTSEDLDDSRDEADVIDWLSQLNMTKIARRVCYISSICGARRQYLVAILPRHCQSTTMPWLLSALGFTKLFSRIIYSLGSKSKDYIPRRQLYITYHLYSAALQRCLTNDGTLLRYIPIKRNRGDLLKAVKSQTD